MITKSEWTWGIKIKPGGLDSQDQSRSRSRTSLVSRLTFLKCRDYPSRQDQLFFFSVEIFKIETFQLRLGCVEIFIEIVETNQDFQDLSRLLRLIEISQHYRDFFKTFLRFQAQKSCQIEKYQSRNVIKLTYCRLRSRQTVEICQKCHVSTDFSIWIETFGTGKWCRDKIKISLSRSRLLNHRDKLFESVEIFSTIETYFFWCRDKSRPPGLIKM